MIQVADIERMSLEERLRVMELLWDSLSRTPEAVASPDWHGEVLHDRLARIEGGQAPFLTLAEVQKRLQDPTP
jgi:putative addiction module component (TIGR02574 family)